MIKFTFHYEQLLRKSKISVVIRSLAVAAAVHNLLPHYCWPQIQKTSEKVIVHINRL